MGVKRTNYRANIIGELTRKSLFFIVVAWQGTFKPLDFLSFLSYEIKGIPKESDRLTDLRRKNSTKYEFFDVMKWRNYGTVENLF